MRHRVLKDVRSAPCTDLCLFLPLYSIRHNQIGADGGKAIAEALASNKVLQSLGIHGNEVGSAQQNAISTTFKGRMDKEDEDANRTLDRKGSFARMLSMIKKDKDEDEKEK